MRGSIAVFALVVALVAGAYWPGLFGPLILDDRPNLGPLLSLAPGTDWWQAIFASGDLGATGSRPIAMLTFVANWLHTGADVPALKATNLVLHLACGLLVFALAGRLLPLIPGIDPGRARWLAVWTGAMWLASPMLVSTVLYAVQRMAQLAALFVLAGLFCYVLGRVRLADRPRMGWVLIGSVAVVWWPLAALSKPNGALLPLLALIVDLYFLGHLEARTTARARRIVAGLVGAAAAAALVRFMLDPRWILAGYEAHAFTPIERLLTQPRVLLDYVANLLMAPFASPLGVYRDDFVLSSGWLDPPATAICMAALIALVAACARAVRGPLAPVAGGVMLFLAASALESSVFALELYFEHRTYLPSVGLFLAAAAGIGLASRKLERPRIVAVGATLYVVLALALLGARAGAWRSAETMLAAELAAHPQSARVHAELAIQAAGRGQLERATHHVDEAERLDRGHPKHGAAVHILALHCAFGRSPPAGTLARLAGAGRRVDDPYTENALRSLADQMERGGCAALDVSGTARAVGDAVTRAAPLGQAAYYQALAHFHAARLHAGAGGLEAALDQLGSARAALPDWIEPGLLEIGYRLRGGDRAGAASALTRLRREHPEPPARYRPILSGFERELGSAGNLPARR